MLGHIFNLSLYKEYYNTLEIQHTPFAHAVIYQFSICFITFKVLGYQLFLFFTNKYFSSLGSENLVRYGLESQISLISICMKYYFAQSGKNMDSVCARVRKKSGPFCSFVRHSMIHHSSLLNNMADLDLQSQKSQILHYRS